MRGAARGLIALVMLSAGCHSTPFGKAGMFPGGGPAGVCQSCGAAHHGSGPLGLGKSARFHRQPPAPPDYVGRGGGLPQDIMDGNATATVTYPYYTVRAPRDFFLDDPPSIGP